MKYLDQFGNLTDEYFGYIYIILDQKHNLNYVGHKFGKVEESDWYYGSGKIISAIQKSRGTYFLKKTILGVCDNLEDLLDCEEECKLFFNVLDPLYGYNLIRRDRAPMDGRKHTKKTKKKMSKVRKNKTYEEIFGVEQAEEVKKKMSESLSKVIRPVFSKEWKEGISKSKIGKKRKPFSQTHKENLSKANKNRVRKKGWHHSKESKEKISKSCQKPKQKSINKEVLKELDLLINQ